MLRLQLDSAVFEIVPSVYKYELYRANLRLEHNDKICHHTGIETQTSCNLGQIFGFQG
jgi:hypothetical protein